MTLLIRVRVRVRVGVRVRVRVRVRGVFPHTSLYLRFWYMFYIAYCMSSTVDDFLNYRLQISIAFYCVYLMRPIVFLLPARAAE